MAVERRTQIWITAAFVVAAIVAVVWSGAPWQEVLVSLAGLAVVFVVLRVATGWGRTGNAGIAAQFGSPRPRVERTYPFIALGILAIAFVLLVAFDATWSIVLAFALTIVAAGVIVAGRRKAQAA